MPQPQEVALNTLPFWSRFTIDVDLRFDGVNLFRQIFQTGFGIPVFDYRKGERNVTALGGAQATARDTILVQANQTRGGGMYHIHGLSFTKDGWPFFRGPQATPPGLEHTKFPPSSLQPGNDGFGPIVTSPEDFRALDSLMWEVFFQFFRIEIRIDGTRRIIEMGPACLYPGVGGPKGPIDTTNGDTFVSNYMPIREGIDWNPAGTVDSQLQVFLEAAYTCTLPTWTAPDGLAPDGTPIVDANPTPMGRLWTQGYICNFHGAEESPTSNVS